MGCHLALEERVAGLICFGYPLVGQNGSVRDEVLLSLDTAVLFVQGSRDKLCPLALLQKTREGMKAASELCEIAGGDHSLNVSASALRKQQATAESLRERIRSSVEEFVQNKH